MAPTSFTVSGKEDSDSEDGKLMIPSMQPSLKKGNSYYYMCAQFLSFSHTFYLQLGTFRYWVKPDIWFWYNIKTKLLIPDSITTIVADTLSIVSNDIDNLITRTFKGLCRYPYY